MAVVLKQLQLGPKDAVLDVSADGRFASVGSLTIASPSIAGGNVAAIRVVDLQTGQEQLIAAFPDRASSHGFGGYLSADGRYIFYGNGAVSAGSPTGNQLFVKDLASGAVTNITPPSSVAFDPAGMSADGQTVLYERRYLLDGQLREQIVVQNWMTGATTSMVDRVATPLFEHIAAGLSGDGRHLIFDESGTSAAYVIDVRSGARTGINMNDSVGVYSLGDNVFSADGRYVAMNGFVNGERQVVVRDLLTGADRVASMSADGLRGDGDSYLVAISPNGRYVAFTSTAGNLVADGDDSFGDDMYIKDLVTGQVVQVLRQGGGGFFTTGGITDDGRLVWTNPTEGRPILIAEFTPPSLSVHAIAGDDVLDGQEKPKTFIVTGTSDSIGAAVTLSAPGHPNLGTGTVASNGTWFAIASFQDFADGAVNVTASITSGGKTTALTHPITIDSQALAVIDPVSFDDLVNLAERDAELRVHGRSDANGRPILVSLDGAPEVQVDTLPDGSWSLDIPGGTLAEGPHAIAIRVTDAVGNTAEASRSLVVDLSAPAVAITTVSDNNDHFVSLPEGASGVLIAGTSDEPGASIWVYFGDHQAGLTTVRPDGTWSVLANRGPASGEVPISVFGSDRAGNTSSDADRAFFQNVDIIRVSAAPFGEANGDSSAASLRPGGPVFSPDGTKVAFTSSADNLAPGDANLAPDIFVRDLATGEVTRASAMTDGSPDLWLGLSRSGFRWPSGSWGPVFSPDGTKLAFISHLDLVTAAGSSQEMAIVVTDYTTGAYQVVAVDPTFKGATSGYNALSFTPDGSRLLYTVGVSYEFGDLKQAFLEDLVTGAVTPVSANARGELADRHSLWTTLSPDGTKAVFLTAATNLMEGDGPNPNLREDYYLKDLTTGAVERLTDYRNENSSALTQQALFEGKAVFSPDGAKVVLRAPTSDHGGLVLKDLVTGETSLIAEYGTNAAFSPDGTKLIYSDSRRPESGSDLYLKDLITGEVSSLPIAPDGSHGNGIEDHASFSPDGKSILFDANSSDLVPGDVNGAYDVFIQAIPDDAILSVFGRVIDGYLSGATVFGDADADGVLDAGEVSTTTDAAGAFALTGASGPLVAFGGSDIATGLAFTGRLTAPAGATVITPLTTLAEALGRAGVADPAGTVLAGLGLPGFDLLHADPVAGAEAGDAAATAALVAGAQVQNLVTLIAAALAGSGGEPATFAGSLVAAMAERLMAQGAFDLARPADIGAVAAAAGLDAAAAAAIATVIAASNAELLAAIGAASPAEAVAAAQLAAQGVLAAQLAGAGSDPAALAALVGAFERAPAPPSAHLVADTGTPGDGITRDPRLGYVADPDAMLLYSVDGSAFTATAPSFATDGSQDGPHTIRVRAVNAAGQATDGASSTIFVLDTTAPSVPGSFLVNDTGVSGDGITGDPTLAYVRDSDASLLYSVDGAAFTATAPVFARNGSQDGTHTVAVRAVDAAGNVTEGTSSTVLVLETLPAPVNDAPTDIVLAPASVAENSASGTVIGTFIATDPDGGDTATFALVSGTGAEDNHLFDIVGNELRLKAGTHLDFEQDASHSVRVRATDQGGLFFEKALTVTVADVSEAATVIGTPSDDSFTAGPGSQEFEAREGIDTIVFGFKLTEVTVTSSGNKIIIDGPGGSHTVLTSFESFAFSDGVVNSNDGNWLVDDLFYYAQHHDVWNARVDADAHFATFGWREGRDPNAFFDTSVYLSMNPDVKAAGINPLTHFDQFGWQEGRAPSPNFDLAQYLAANPDIAAAKIDPLAHFLQLGASEGRQPFAHPELLAPDGFDYVYYLANNADVAAANIDPFQHFQQFGWKEGRNPNALFDTTGYLAAYGDVKAAGVNPLDHYHLHGWKEGRDPGVGFDTTEYLAAYGHVKAAGIDPLAHYLAFGQGEERIAFADDMFG